MTTTTTTTQPTPKAVRSTVTHDRLTLLVPCADGFTVRVTFSRSGERVSFVGAPMVTAVQATALRAHLQTIMRATTLRAGETIGTAHQRMTDAVQAIPAANRTVAAVAVAVTEGR